MDKNEKNLYENYKLQWMIEHGYNLKDLVNMLMQEQKHIHQNHDDYESINENDLTEVLSVFEKDSGFGKKAMVWDDFTTWKQNHADKRVYQRLQPSMQNDIFVINQPMGYGNCEYGNLEGTIIKDEKNPALFFEYLRGYGGYDSREKGPSIVIDAPEDNVLRVLVWGEDDKEECRYCIELLMPEKNRKDIKMEEIN